MLHAMFHIPVPVLEKVLRAALVYAFLVAALRLAGKRELAQLSTIDFVVLLAVANAVQNGIIGKDDSVSGGLIGATTLFFLNGMLAFVLYRSKALRRVVEGTPTTLIADGEVLEDGLRREEITREELMIAVQRQGADDLTEVKRAVLDPSGSIVITRRQPSEEMAALRRLEARLDELTAAVAKGRGR